MVSILFAAGATEVHSGVGLGEHWSTSLEAALAELTDDVPESQMHVYASHPMGTCKMGRDPRSSVVAPSGQTHDVPGLWIADASVFPSSLGVNPQLTVMAMGLMIGENVARSV